MSAAQLSSDLDRARALYEAGYLADAGQAYRAVLAAEPRHAEALWRLGDIANRLGVSDKALDLVHASIAVEPNDPQAWNCLGAVYATASRLHEAVTAFARAIELRPNFVLAFSNLGKAYLELGRPNEAVMVYRHCVDLEPTWAAHHTDLGNALLASGQPDAALESFNSALTLDPMLAEARFGVGLAHGARDDQAAAVLSFTETVRRHPDLAEAHHNLGLALFKCGRLEEAVDAFRAAVALNPTDIRAHTNLVFAMDLDPRVGLAEAMAERKRWNDRHGRAVVRTDHANVPDPDRRLRIGYVSGDLKAHSAAEALAPIIFGHTGAFEIVCYSQVRTPDSVTERFRAAVPFWRESWQMDDDALERCIRDDAIDILVDLSGFTNGHRLTVFARKPAPIQVQAWGYPLGSGMPAIDYLMSDAVLIPPESRGFFVETIHDLPGFMPFAPPANSPAITAPPAEANALVTFGSMNRLTKINDDVLRVWAEILTRAPNARLLAKDPAFDDAQTCVRMVEYFAARGIAVARITLRGASTRREHLATYAEIDVALDPFPQSGGITTFESLWMGVPVITLAGDRPQGRVSASILTGVGLPQTVATTAEEYVARAVDWCGDVRRLSAVRAGLRHKLRNSPFCDHEAYIGVVETAYRGFWRRWCASRRK